jgi:glycosyltransferase involved in cell wall biosynthesis
MDNQKAKIRVAVLFERLGPYHHARLTAAGKLMEVHGVESCGMEEFYAWEKMEGADSFHRVTLTERYEHTRRWRQMLQKRMIETLDGIKPDAVAVSGWSYINALAALWWCMTNRVPVIIMSESTEWDAERSAWREAMKRRIVGLCSAALVGGRPHKEYMVKLGMPAERIFLGYDAVDGEYFASEAQRARSEAAAAPSSQLPAPSSQLPALRPPTSDLRSPVSAFQNVSVSAFQNAPFFLASARFIEKKNLPRLLKAFSRYRELAGASVKRCDSASVEQVDGNSGELDTGSPVHLNPEKLKHQTETPKHRNTETPTSDLWQLVLLGDGPLLSSLRSQVSSLGLQHSVLLPGFKQYPELPAYYAHAGAFIHASTTEQWGLVVNEAMASGLPVLVSNRCGCASDLVQEGVNGFTFDPYDVEQLAQLMFQVSGFGFQVSKFGDASRTIISEWGPERFAAGLKAAVECALKVGPKRATLLQRMVLKAMLAR